MHRFSRIFLAFFCIFIGMAHADVYDPAYYNSQQYFHKEEIIENNFFPVMRLSELIDGYKANMGAQGQNNKYVNIEISQDDWKEFMTHYFSDKRFLDIADFPMKATFSHGDGSSEIINGTMRHRGNYSTRSLKAGFRVELNRAIQHGVFKDDTQVAFRHLVFDASGINEYVYYQAWDSLHTDLLGFTPLVPSTDYYWVFINGKLYGYYLALNDSKPELLKKRGEVFDPANDCLIKAKVWAADESADMHYSSLYDTLEGFEKIYVIEGGNHEKCYQEVTQMMQDLDNGHAENVLSKFRDPKQIAYQARFVDKTGNKTGVHQNYILLKHNKLWEISPWDADMSFDSKYTFGLRFLSENALFSAALSRYPETLPANLDDNISKLFYAATAAYIDQIRIDRKIWSRYLPKRDSHISDKYIQYIDPEYQPDSIDAIVLELVHATYQNILSSLF